MNLLIFKIGPMLMISFTYILYLDIGLISIIVPIINFGIILIQQKIAIRIKNLIAKKSKLADDRGKTIGDTLAGIKMVKFNVWEEIILEKIDRIRKIEMQILLSLYRWSSLVRSFKTIMPKITSLLLFTMFWIMNKEISIPQMFSILSILNYIEVPLAGVVDLMKSYAIKEISSKRIENILKVRDQQPLQDSKDLPLGTIEVDDLTSTWSDGYHESLFRKPSIIKSPVLNSITSVFKPGSFTGIYGAVGAGKTSLLLSIISEIPLLSGTIKKHGKIAYVPQNPFLISATIRTNILFGEEFEEDRYNQVLRLCELGEDMSIFPAGDNTEVGERGITLSGGQKQRISLARAIYSDSDIYVIDDALSALDPEISSRIFVSVFQTYLSSKTRILALHALSLRPLFTSLLFLKAGNLIASGSLQEVEENVDFQVFIAHESNDKKGQPDAPKELINSNKKVDLKESDVQQIENNEKFTKGQVGARTYLMYLKAAGVGLGIITLALFILSSMMSIWMDWWIGKNLEKVFGSSSTLESKLNYILLIGSLITVVAIRMIMFGAMVTKSSYNMFKAMIYSIMRRKMSYFDTTPSGIILNRCTKDTFSIDYSFPDIIMLCIETVLMFVLTFALASYYTVISTIFAIIFIYVIKRNFGKYMKTSIQLSRMAKVTSSPVLTKITEMIGGAVVIRQYGKQQYFKEIFEANSDLDTTINFHERLSDSWLKMRLELSILSVIWCSVFSIAIARVNGIFGKKESVSVGLVLNYLLILSNMTGGLMYLMSRTMKEISSVERVQEFIEFSELEPDWKKENSINGWPEKGDIEIQNLRLRYRDGLPLVLNGLNLRINHGEKVGIVGRTGSGKSSIFSALCRIVEAETEEPCIFIDDVDIRELGLHQLRKAITVIPQDPFLLEGTLRLNLDPYSVHPDSMLISTLKSLDFISAFRGVSPSCDSLESLLSLPLTPFSELLSQGQRQLVSLSRALLSSSPIILLDEATASIDERTEAMVSAALKTPQFSDKTVLAIAHRKRALEWTSRIETVDQGKTLK